MTVTEVVDVVSLRFVKVDVAWVVTVTEECFFTAVVLSTVDVKAGRVKVDLAVANFATTVVEVVGLSVVCTVRVLRSVEVMIEAYTVVLTVCVGIQVTV